MQGRDRAAFLFPAPMVKQHISLGVLQVYHLRSFEHMGIFHINVSAVKQQAEGAGDCKLGSAAIALASQIVDTLWLKHESVTVMEEVKFVMPELASAAHGA